MGIFCSIFVFIALWAGIGLIVAVVKKVRKTSGWPNIFIYIVKTAIAVLLLLGLYLVSHQVPFRAAIFWSATLMLPLFFGMLYLLFPKTLGRLFSEKMGSPVPSCPPKTGNPV